MRFWERPLRILAIQPYRCMACWYRVYVMFLPFNLLLQVTTKGTSRRFQRMVLAVTRRVFMKAREATYRPRRASENPRPQLLTNLKPAHPLLEKDSHRRRHWTKSVGHLIRHHESPPTDSSPVKQRRLQR
jgi:hypothetical protein